MKGPGGRPLRVAHLTTVDMSLALLLATELAIDVEAGFETIGVSTDGPWVAQVEALGVAHASVGFTRSWDLRRDAGATVELARCLRRLDLDVLHTHTPKAGVLGRVLGRVLRIPVVVNTCHGLWVQEGGSRKTRLAVVAIEGLAARFSHHELFQNADDRDALRWAVPDRRATVVGNGIDLDRFRFDPAGRSDLRAEWGVADDEVLIGGVGRRVAEKGIAELGVAARALVGKARVVWVGPDDEDKADALRVGEDGIEFTGARTDMPAVYSAFDIFALPSYREGFSRSAMEAAACGRPMVLTDIRGCREVGVHEQHLLLVPPRSSEGLTAALERLVADEHLRRRLGEAARTRAQEAFDQRFVAATSIETYRRVAERRGLGWEA